MSLLMLDICAGLGGAHQAMKPPGWEVVSVDNDPTMPVTIVADIRSWHWTGRRPDLVWASPPCTEFTSDSMPWQTRPVDIPGAIALVAACKRIIDETQPRHWVIENVRGSYKYLRPLLGNCIRVGPYHLWGTFTNIPIPWGPINQRQLRPKESYPPSPQRAALRAQIPYALSNKVRELTERSLTLWPQE